MHRAGAGRLATKIGAPLPDIANALVVDSRILCTVRAVAVFVEEAKHGVQSFDCARCKFLAAFTLCAALPALAQPQKTLRVLVGFPAGQTTDIVARVVAERLSQSLGHPIIIENRPGQGGSLALGLVAQAPPDGSVMTISDG